MAGKDLHRAAIRSRLVLTLVAALIPAPVLAAEGYVILNQIECRARFVIQTTMGFAILEHYGGSDPDEGDLVVGDFESYGIKDIYNATSQTTLRVWVEDYWLSRARVIEKMQRFCR